MQRVVCEGKAMVRRGSFPLGWGRASKLGAGPGTEHHGDLGRGVSGFERGQSRWCCRGPQEP